MSEQKSLPNWAKEKTENNKKEVFKLKEGSKTVLFDSEGKEWKDEIYDKRYIIFDLIVDAKPMVWFYPYAIKDKVSALGFPLKGKEVTVTRFGSGRKDTRWTLTTVEQ